MSTTTNIVNISPLDSYLGKYFYVKLPLDQFNATIYYNTMLNDILSIIRLESISDIEKLIEFSDYVIIIADGLNRVEIQDEKIGIVYIDPKANVEDSLIIVRLPTLQKVLPDKRIEILVSSKLKNAYKPFWEIYKGQGTPLIATKTNEKDLEYGKVLVEKGITNFYEKYTINRADIIN